MMCQRIGRFPTGIIGFGVRWVSSPIRTPKPPQKMTTFITKSWGTTVFQSSFRAKTARLSTLANGSKRDRNNQTATPIADRRQLTGDLVDQIPRQNEDVVRLRFQDLLRREDRDVRPRREQPVLVRVAVDRVIEEIAPDSAVVE